MSRPRRERIAEAGVHCIGVALAVLVRAGRVRHRFELSQGEPALMCAVEQLEAVDRGLTEFGERDRTVEVGIRRRDRLGEVLRVGER